MIEILVWVMNDYHLSLVPQLVRQNLPNAIIGFSCTSHGPAPRSSVVSQVSPIHPNPQAFLVHFLSCLRTTTVRSPRVDLIGFQTHNYARHFRQTCSRILALEALPKGIQLENSFVDVAVFPIGIDVADLTLKRYVAFPVDCVDF